VQAIAIQLWATIVDLNFSSSAYTSDADWLDVVFLEHIQLLLRLWMFDWATYIHYLAMSPSTAYQ
jgi:hypothetical protein